MFNKYNLLRTSILSIACLNAFCLGNPDKLAADAEADCHAVCAKQYDICQEASLGLSMASTFACLNTMTGCVDRCPGPAGIGTGG
jgi:hypothetical protein